MKAIGDGQPCLSVEETEVKADGWREEMKRDAVMWAFSFCVLGRKAPSIHLQHGGWASMAYCA